jgi:hypothetical protein
LPLYSEEADDLWTPHSSCTYDYEVPMTGYLRSRSFLVPCPHKERHSQSSINSSNTLPWKWGPSKNDHHMIKEPYFKLPHFGEDPTYFILPFLNLIEYKRTMKEVTKFTSQSCIGLVKDIFH